MTNTQYPWICKTPCCEHQPGCYTIDEEDRQAYCDECGCACESVELLEVCSDSIY